jgi:hypothetical protein
MTRRGAEFGSNLGIFAQTVALARSRNEWDKCNCENMTNTS